MQRYLEAWLPIISRFQGKVFFLDGFAGPGRYNEGEPGSPVIALDTIRNHTYLQTGKRNCQFSFAFIEQEPKRFESLESIIEGLSPDLPPWVTTQTLCDEFDPYLNRVLQFAEENNRRLAPTFAFIDPFGYSGIPLSTLVRLAQHERCEVLITFMYQSINRFVTEEKIAPRLNELYGCEDWRPVQDMTEPDERQEFLIGLYKNQLINTVGFKYVRAFAMTDINNSLLYYLVFGTSNKLGLSKMKQAMWKVDPGGGEIFSDYTAAQGPTLFEPTPDLANLQAIIVKQFGGGGTVSIEAIEDYVLFETPYSEAMHLKQGTLKPLEMARRLEVISGRKKNRPGDYPKGTILVIK